MRLGLSSPLLSWWSQSVRIPRPNRLGPQLLVLALSSTLWASQVSERACFLFLGGLLPLYGLTFLTKTPTPICGEQCVLLANEKRDVASFKITECVHSCESTQQPTMWPRQRSFF